MAGGGASAGAASCTAVRSRRRPWPLPAAFPGLSGLVASTAPEAPAVDANVTEAADDSGALTEPLVAQVKDITTGEISLFQGEREVVVRSPELARSLLSAAKK